MKQLWYNFFLLFVVLLQSQIICAQSAFTKNQGQWNSSILYKSDFHSGRLYIENASLNYNFFDFEDLSQHVYDHHKVNHYHSSIDQKYKAHCLKMNLNGASFEHGHSELQKIKEYTNYYIGNNPKKWASKVPAFKSLEFLDVYKNIDFHIDITEKGYKYDFIIKPNADITQVNISYQGAEEIWLDHENLHIKTSINEIVEIKPYAYQYINGEKIEVQCSFELKDKQISFKLPDSYDKEYNLIIDPDIVFARYSSSFADNFGYTATFDSDENAYGAGSVFGINYITTPGAYDLTFNGANTDIGIIKYSSDGLQRIYSTYLGGSGTDLPHSIVVNGKDELYVMSTTSSADFPIDTFFTTISSTFIGGPSVVFNGLAVTYSNGSDLAIARFNPDGSNLLSSTFLGGSENDGLNTSNFLIYNYADEIRGEILIDEEDNCFIVSCTESTDFPHVTPFQASNAGGLDAIIVKMDENLTEILWSSYLGGSSDDASYSIDFDSQKNLVIAGGTNSSDFPLLNPYQSVYGGSVADGFITKIHTSGFGITASTYYGENSYDQIYFVELNDMDEVHIFGQTQAPANSLISNATYNNPNGGQILARLNADLDSVIWATRFGDGQGLPDISPTAFLVDVCNRVFLSGWGWGADAQISGTDGLDVTVDAIDSTTDNQDFYFMVLQDDASELVYASFFGGNLSREHVDGGTSRFDKKGIIYQAVCAGCGGNQDFPTTPIDSVNSWRNNSPNCNLGVVKYSFSPPSVISDFSLPPILDCAPVNYSFTNESQTAFNDTSEATFYWVVNGDSINSYDLNYDFNSSGVFDIILYAIDSQSCNTIDSVTKRITVLGNSTSTLEPANLCEGNSVQVGLTLNSDENINFEWTPDYFLSNTNISNPFASPPVDTSYQLILTNGNCSDTLIQEVRLESLEIAIEPFDSVCLESSINLTSTPIPGALYVWSPPELVLSGQNSNIATVRAQNSNQSISVFVTDPNGCSNFETVNLLTIDDLPDLELSADPDTIQAGQNAQLLALSDEALFINWQSNPHFETLDIFDPLAENIQQTTTFVARADNGVCPKEDSITVQVVLPDCLQDKFFVPNAFSPNDDGNNDVFKIRTSILNIENFYFAVYDRWGTKIFETYDKNEGWDGTFKGNEMTPNVYGWYSEGLCPNGENYFVKGNVTLLK